MAGNVKYHKSGVHSLNAYPCLFNRGVTEIKSLKNRVQHLTATPIDPLFHNQ